MPDQVLLYISAASDLEGERALLGRAVTEIPVTLGWRIIQTPRRGEPVDLQAVRQAEAHILLLGSDIRAPVGLEWSAARRAGKHPLLFLKENLVRTPAAVSFIRYIENQDSWRRFQDNADLRRQVLIWLADHLIERAVSYPLAPEEYQRLEEWRKELAEVENRPVEEARRGTGDSGVILSAERYTQSKDKSHRK